MDEVNVTNFSLKKISNTSIINLYNRNLTLDSESYSETLSPNDLESVIVYNQRKVKNIGKILKLIDIACIK